MISFACPSCNRKLLVKDEFAGKRGTCPHCKKSLLVPVPAAATVPQRPVTPASPAAANPPPLAETITAPLPDDTPSSPAVGALKLDFLAKPQAADELGRLGSYRVLKVLGAGGMGMVLLADDPVLKRPVALKVMRPELAADNTARQRFLREAQATAAIDHHHIIHIYQVGAEGGVPFIAMPLLKGETLDARLKREKRLSIADAVMIGKQIADGLAVAHKHGLVHRDIKPANIWLSDDGEPGASATGVIVKIVDFGLARAVAGDDVHLTQTGAILGTPAYMAPEQAKSEQVDFRCDLFSLGAVLYRMLTGELPFKGHNTMSLLRALEMDSPRPVQSLNPEVPPVLADLVMQLLAKEPAQRPPTAKAVAELLGGIAGEGTLPLSSSPRPGTPGRGAGGEGFGRRMAHRLAALLWSLRPWAFRRPGLAFAVEGVLLALLLLLISLPFMSRKQDVASRERERPDNIGMTSKKDVASRERERPENIGPEKAITNSIGMELAWVPPGKSWLGGGGGKPGTQEFTLAKGLWCGVYPVTQAEWQAVMGNNPSHFAGHPRQPVEQVSWNDVQEFLRKLNSRLADGGLTYRLPSEAEWEYICRGGPISQAQSAFHFYFARSKTDLTSVPTNDLSSRQANFDGNHPAGSASKGPYLEATSEVGLYLPNPLGIYDLHGNVWEWTSTPEGSSLMIRGGCWSSDAGNCTASDRVRHWAGPGRRASDLGFRVLAVPSGAK